MEAIMIAVIAAAAPVAAVVVSYRKGANKLAEVHVLVNARLDEALSEIAELKHERDERERDLEGREVGGV